MSDSVDRVFVHALNTVKRIPRTGTARPPAAERLALYGLYKQSMEGDVEGVMDRPVGNTPDVYAECEKWDAWYAQRGLSRTEAKRRYISTLIDTMHEYASQTAEARELVSELEFVWDQIKSNTSSLSSSSSPVATVAVPPHSQPNYASISGRLARPIYEDIIATARDNGRGDSRLRVLSPVSQPDRLSQPHGSNMNLEDEGEQELEEDVDEEEEEEEYEEAQDTLYGNDDDDDINHNHHNQYEHNIPESYNGEGHHEERGRARGSIDQKNNPRANSGDPDRRWRRRVEQALTKMTAEVAAVREQMETRALASRRRSGVWAWLKWIVWVTFRQILFDLAILGILLIRMRLKGDLRLEEKLKIGWSEVKTRLAKLKCLRVYIF